MVHNFLGENKVRKFLNDIQNKFTVFSYVILLLSLSILQDVTPSKYIELIEVSYFIVFLLINWELAKPGYAE